MFVLGYPKIMLCIIIVVGVVLFFFLDIVAVSI